MKTYLLPAGAGAALLLALLVTGCESDGGMSARAQEKSATYAALKPWQKKYIDKGAVTIGFTTDMVYISMGRPDKVDTKDLAEGKAELWTYSRYYPSVDRIHTGIVPAVSPQLGLALGQILGVNLVGPAHRNVDHVRRETDRDRPLVDVLFLPRLQRGIGRGLFLGPGGHAAVGFTTGHKQGEQQRRARARGKEVSFHGVNKLVDVFVGPN